MKLRVARRCLVLAAAMVLPAGSWADLVSFVGYPTIARSQFRSAATTRGHTLEATETFENCLFVGPGNEGILLPDPLTSGVPNVTDNGSGFPNGLLTPNLTIQSNPIGAGLNMINELTAFNPTKCASPGGAESTLDILVGDTIRYAVGFDVQNPWAGFPGPALGEIRVYDRNDNFLGLVTCETSTRVVNFVGILSDTPIGRINFSANDAFSNTGMGKEFTDNLELWVPEPGTAVLMAPALVFLLRRRSV